MVPGTLDFLFSKFQYKTCLIDSGNTGVINRPLGLSSNFPEKWREIHGRVSVPCLKLFVLKNNVCRLGIFK